jgi:hypothetical protein
MIHGEFSRCKRPLAVGAAALGNFIPPPLRLSQFSGFVFFSADMTRIFVNFNPVSQAFSF